MYTNILRVFLTLFYPLMYIRTWVRVPPVTLTCAIMVIQPWAPNGYLYHLYGGHGTLPLHGDTWSAMNLSVGKGVCLAADLPCRQC